MMARSPIPTGNLPQHNTTMKLHHFFLRKSGINGPSIQNYPPVSSNCSNGNCLQAKVSMVNYTWNILQLAMFHYQRVELGIHQPMHWHHYQSVVTVPFSIIITTKWRQWSGKIITSHPKSPILATIIPALNGSFIGLSIITPLETNIDVENLPVVDDFPGVSPWVFHMFL